MESGWAAAGGESVTAAVAFQSNCSPIRAVQDLPLPRMLLVRGGLVMLLLPRFSCVQTPPPSRSPLNRFRTPLLYPNQIRSARLKASC